MKVEDERQAMWCIDYASIVHRGWNTVSGPLCLMAYSNAPALFMYNRQPCLPACLPPWWCSRCMLHKACYGCWHSCVHEFSLLLSPIPSALSLSPIPIVHGPVGSVQRMRSVEGKIHQESERRDIPPAFLSLPSPYIRQRLLWRLVKVEEFYPCLAYLYTLYIGCACLCPCWLLVLTNCATNYKCFCSESVCTLASKPHWFDRCRTLANVRILSED